MAKEMAKKSDKRHFDLLIITEDQKPARLSCYPLDLTDLLGQVQKKLGWETLPEELRYFDPEFSEYLTFDSLTSLKSKVKLKAIKAAINPDPSNSSNTAHNQDKDQAIEWAKKGASFSQTLPNSSAMLIPMIPQHNIAQFNLPMAVDFLAEAEKKKPNPVLWAYFRRMRGLPVMPSVALVDRLDELNALTPQQALLNFFEAMNSEYPDWPIYSAIPVDLLAMIDQKAQQLKTIGSLLVANTSLASASSSSIPPSASLSDANTKLYVELASLKDKLNKANEKSKMLIAYQLEDIRQQGTYIESKYYDYSTVRITPAWEQTKDRLYSTARIPELEPSIRAFFFESIPDSVSILRIEFVQNFVLKARFESTIVGLANTTYEPLCQPYTPTDEKSFVYGRIKPRFVPAVDNKKVRIGLCWGTNNAPDAIRELCHGGLADIRVLSPGFFGTGISVTPQAKYGIAYSPKPPPPNSDGEYCLLLCWVVFSNIYPVSRDTDYDSSSSPSHFFDEKRGIALKAGYDCHCACVDPKRHYQAAKFIESQGTFDRDSKDLVDEIILKESSQALPYCIVYYKK